MFNCLIEPNTNQKINLFSKKGIQLLKRYVQKYYNYLGGENKEFTNDQGLSIELRIASHTRGSLVFASHIMNLKTYFLNEIQSFELNSKLNQEKHKKNHVKNVKILLTDKLLMKFQLKSHVYLVLL